jgi:hypothetical protein
MKKTILIFFLLALVSCTPETVVEEEEGIVKQTPTPTERTVVEEEEGIVKQTPTPTERTVVEEEEGIVKQTPMPTERPEDFKVIYYWDVGSLPPPHHYSYTITIGPDAEGEIEFVAGYAGLSFDNPSIWIEEFEVSEDELDALYFSVYFAGVFEEKWEQMEVIPTGDSADGMIVIAYGGKYLIPSYVVGEDKTKTLEFTIKNSVPQEIWDKLNEQYEKYVEEYKG